MVRRHHGGHLLVRRARSGAALPQPARIDRRQVLAGLAAAAAAGASGPAGAAFAPFRRKVGAIEVAVFSDGSLDVPLSFSLPDTPPDQVGALLASQGLPPGGGPTPANPTLVRTGGEMVLIDAGAGAGFQAGAGKLGANLEAAGIDPAHVTRIVLTHAHADHLWGVIDELDEERFPNARYVIAAPERDFWTHPDTVGKVPDWLKPTAQAAARILRRIEPRLETRKAGESVAPGLSYLDTSGHTPGHMSVLVEDGGAHLLVGGDVLSHPAISFARPDWRIGSDYDRARGAATRSRLLDRLAIDRIPLIGFHLPWPGHGMVERTGTAYRFVAA
jgi:glyoxylase-like metal-dependent hydrolase (beta-lactamase superfamily II)